MAMARKIYIPTGWQKIPWEEGYKWENYNPNLKNAMFVVGNIIAGPNVEPMQIVNKKFGISLGVEWWYQIIPYFGKPQTDTSNSWFVERDLNRYTITREWQLADKSFVNPQTFRKVFFEGDRLSLLFDQDKPTARTYLGVIAKKIQYFENAKKRPRIKYQIRFEDGDTLEFDHYRLLWMLGNTERYLATLPYAEVGEYTGGDIPIAQPGLRF